MRIFQLPSEPDLGPKKCSIIPLSSWVIMVCFIAVLSHRTSDAWFCFSLQTTLFLKFPISCFVHCVLRYLLPLVTVLIFLICFLSILSLLDVNATVSTAAPSPIFIHWDILPSHVIESSQPSCFLWMLWFCTESYGCLPLFSSVCPSHTVWCVMESTRTHSKVSLRRPPNLFFLFEELVLLIM